jgi:hypothetical protein
MGIALNGLAMRSREDRRRPSSEQPSARPWGLLVATGLALIGAAVLAARLATRQALDESPSNAVREDW